MFVCQRPFSLNAGALAFSGALVLAGVPPARVTSYRDNTVKHLGNTPPYRGPNGETLPHSIAEIGYLRLGGLDQWIMIRGENVANPVLVLVHGGPGFPEMRLLRFFNAPLEKDFTVVYWEQRGTGNSFDPKIPRSSMTVEQFIADLDELVNAMRKRFKKDKVAIYGHSWGSALGVLFAARFPHKVAAFVGAGQVGDWPASETLGYNFTLKEAQRRRNHKAIRELRAIGPPPHTGSEQMVQGKWQTRFFGMVRNMSMWRLSRILLRGPEFSVFDLPGILRGTLFSTHSMWEEVSAINLIKAAPALAIPVFFFLGRHDRVIAPETSVAYFDVLSAPSKRLVWFEESAHVPPFEEPAKFNATMAELLRAAAVSAPYPS
jgi:pimeloyl-ACP methyl ester carboxylesterase